MRRRAPLNSTVREPLIYRSSLTCDWRPGGSWMEQQTPTGFEKYAKKSARVAFVMTSSADLP